MLLILGCTAASIQVGLPGPTDTTAGEDTPAEVIPGETGETGETAETAETADTGEAPPTEDLYDPLRILELGLSIDDAAWSSLARDGTQFVEVTLLYGDATLPVRIHIKGSSTWQAISQKPSLVVDVNGVVAGTEFLNAKKFYLHNQMYDPSMMSETLSYGFYRAWGYPAARTNYAHLTVNDADYGLYTIVEPYNDDFLEDWFDDPDGNLYENSAAYCDVWDVDCMEHEETDEGDDNALHRLGGATRSGDFATDVWPLLNGDRFIQYLAFEAGIAHWDSYSYDLSNYVLYHEPTSDTWTMLTQSMDLDYGWRPWSYPECGMYGIDAGTYTMGALAAQCQEDPACHAAFVAGVVQVADGLEAADGAARVAELDALIGDAVRADPRKQYGNSDYTDHVACLKGFFAERPGDLRAWAANDPIAQPPI